MIPLVDLKAQYRLYKDEFLKAAEEVMSNTAFVLGKYVDDFEKKFAEFIGSPYAVGVASGTDALHLALRAAGISQGDEVITTANTFVATTLAVEMLGARPVLVDCDPTTYLMDMAAAEKAVTPKTRAIIPVHLYGQVAPMDEVMALAERHNLTVIEDACQSHGAKYKGRTSGTFGLMGTFSFFPGKNLGAYGDGGAITTNDQKTYEELLGLRNYGSTKKYYHPKFGVNSRLDGIQAAILNVKLKYIEEWNDKRNRAAERYIKNLEGHPSITLPVRAKNSTHVFHLFVIQLEGNRDQIMAEMAKKEIYCGIHYPIPIHMQKAYSYLGHKEGDFPVTEALAKKILSLPIYPEITDEQIDFVCKTLMEILK